MFCIEMKSTNNFNPLGSSEELVKEYDPELDSIISILADICDVLADANSFMFYVKGFGENPWPLDIRTDLLTFMLQLPAFLNWLDSLKDVPFFLDFYEQGTERSLTFTKINSEIKIDCSSRTTWKPNPETEMIEEKSLNYMLSNFVQVFVNQVKIFTPEISHHSWFQEWCETKAIKTRLF